jgi:hypothetical protein
LLLLTLFSCQRTVNLQNTTTRMVHAGSHRIDAERGILAETSGFSLAQRR